MPLHLLLLSAFSTIPPAGIRAAASFSSYRSQLASHSPQKPSLSLKEHHHLIPSHSLAHHYVLYYLSHLLLPAALVFIIFIFSHKETTPESCSLLYLVSPVPRTQLGTQWVANKYELNEWVNDNESITENEKGRRKGKNRGKEGWRKREKDRNCLIPNKSHCCG